MRQEPFSTPDAALSRVFLPRLAHLMTILLQHTGPHQVDKQPRNISAKYTLVAYLLDVDMTESLKPYLFITSFLWQQIQDSLFFKTWPLITGNPAVSAESLVTQPLWLLRSVLNTQCSTLLNTRKLAYVNIDKILITVAIGRKGRLQTLGCGTFFFWVHFRRKRKFSIEAIQVHGFQV